MNCSRLVVHQAFSLQDALKCMLSVVIHQRYLSVNGEPLADNNPELLPNSLAVFPVLVVCEALLDFLHQLQGSNASLFVCWPCLRQYIKHRLRS